MSVFPLVSIIIPHYGSSEILYTCLDSVSRSTYPRIEVILVDNGSDLDERRLSDYPVPIQYIKNEKNLGFAGGCNRGVKKAGGVFIVLLNNDTIVDPDWIEPLLRTMESDENIAACQPKLLSSRFPGNYDYAGGCGGLMDIFAYPFALGRMFDSLEVDQGLYQGTYRIFWASGTASIWRKELFQKVGYLDEDFFAHMEEIDLNWRCQLAGYKILAITDSVVRHYSGYSLRHGSWQKMYLNHRNNLIMMIKNLHGNNLIWILPLRLVLEFSTVLVAMVSLDWRRVLAVLRAQLYIAVHFGSIWRKRSAVQSTRKLSDSIVLKHVYRGSIVWQYFLHRRKKVSQFMEISSVEYS